ncbi:MAG TPA: ATP-binding cassette domain-containing protein [Symbiobacteriaceae bacterium]|nr:ATP-binding cassette domain-containing protein [Symbiobacteriaceae bacterium]
MLAIETQSLTRQFTRPARGQSVWQRLLAPKHETITAVSDVNLAVQEGEVIGYIGPNGAGKSTTIKMLLGVLHPSGGNVTVLGRNPFRERIANNLDVGVVWGNRNYLTWDVPVQATLERYRRIYSVSQADFEERLSLCKEYLEVDSLLHVHARQLSLGQRMRCNLTNVLLHRPRILYLDEPTIGLDVLVKHQVRRFLRHINREWGTTILLTTHDLGDIEDLCPRIVVIDKGRLLLDDRLEAVRERLGGGVRITFQFAPEHALPDEICAQLAGEIPGVTARTEPGPRLVVQVPRTSATPIQVIRWIVARLEPINLQVDEAPIDEVVKRIYSGRIGHVG